MHYKASKFNYYTKKAQTDGTTILMNTYKGVTSICKTSSDKKEQVLKLLNSDKIVDDGTELFGELVERGFLVKEDCDENQRLKLLYNSNIDDRNLNIVILPTEQCNYRCVYCYESFERGRLSADLQNAIVEYVKSNINKYQGLHISWFGGEPLIAVDIIESLSKKLIELCKYHRKPYVSDVTTNGYCLDLETFKKLYKLHITNYVVTIDGTKKTHDKQKPLAGGGKTFDRVVNNLLSIKDNVKSQNYHIIIRTNFTPEIYSHLEEYVEFFYERFTGDRRFSFLARPAGDWGGERVKEVSGDLFVDNDYTNVFKKMLSFNKYLDYRKHINFMQPTGSMCQFSKVSTILVDSAGNIRKCSCDLDNPKNIIGKFEQGEAHIDVDQHAMWVDTFELDEICKDCFFAPACLNSGCPAKKAIGRGINGKCQVYEKEYIEYLLLLINQTDEIEVIG